MVVVPSTIICNPYLFQGLPFRTRPKVQGTGLNWRMGGWRTEAASSPGMSRTDPQMYASFWEAPFSSMLADRSRKKNRSLLLGQTGRQNLGGSKFKVFILEVPLL